MKRSKRRAMRCRCGVTRLRDYNTGNWENDRVWTLCGTYLKWQGLCEVTVIQGFSLLTPSWLYNKGWCENARDWWSLLRHHCEGQDVLNEATSGNLPSKLMLMKLYGSIHYYAIAYLYIPDISFQWSPLCDSCWRLCLSNLYSYSNPAAFKGKKWKQKASETGQFMQFILY